MKIVKSNTSAISRLSNKFLFCLFILSLFSVSINAQDHSQNCGASKKNDQVFEYHNEFVYEMWQNYENSDGCMVVKQNEDFYASWTNIRNTLVRKSLRNGQAKTNQQIDYYIDNQFSGNAFHSCYGWWEDKSQNFNSHERVIEYYVVEGYGDVRPDHRLKSKTTYTIAGEGTYELLIGGADGNWTGATVYGAADRNFTQIKAIRTSTRTSGKISMAQHFNKWAEFGYPVGDLHEVSYKVEGFYQPGLSGSKTSGGAYVRADFGTAGSYTGGSSSGNNNNNPSGTFSGNYRLKNKWAGYYATSDNKEQAIVKMTNKEDWSSQEWKFEHISGNEYRLREQYGNRYLRATSSNGGGVEVRSLRSSWNSQKWILEKFGSYYRLKSKWTGRYLRGHNQKWGNVTTHDDRNWASLQWTLQKVGAGKSSNAPTTTTIAEAEAEARVITGIAVYPNPATAIVNVEVPPTSDSEIKVGIYNILGVLVQEISTVESISTVDVSGLSKGNYVMMITTGGDSTTKIFVKN